MIKKLKKYISVIFLNLVKYFISPFIKIDNNLVLFSSLNGSFVDNSKYLYLAIIKENNFKTFWVAHDKNTFKFLKDQNLPVLKIGYGMFFKALKAKFFVTTHNYQDVYYVKNKKTVVINLWHGTPLKKMGFDAKVDSKKFYLKEKLGLYEHKYIDYLCIASKHTVYAFESSFGIAKEKILPTGQPRNDILFKAKSDFNFAQSIKENVLSKLNIKSPKIALYAPTFRDKYICRVDLIKELKEIFKQNGVELVVKLHPLDKDRVYFKQPSIDIQELLIASDMLISDYSSVFFDYAILERPIILFLYDIKEYQIHRDGFYMDIEQLPFYKCYNTEQLKTTLQRLLRNTDTAKISEFADKFNRKGCSSCRIMKFMKKIANS